MKKITGLKTPAAISKIVFFVFSFFVSVIAFAQDKKLEIDIDTKEEPFWGKPWVWVVGAAVFILLLVALLRGGKRNN